MINPKKQTLVTTRRRKPIEVRTTARVHVADYWDGGGKTTHTFVRLSDRAQLDPREFSNFEAVPNPFGLPIFNVDLPDGVV